MEEIICLGGLTTSGKTTIALMIEKVLAPRAEIIDPDPVWLKIIGKPPGQPLRSGETSEHLHPRMMEIMTLQTQNALDAGKTAIIPYTFRTESRRSHFETLASSRGARFQGFWLMADIDAMVERAASRKAAWDNGNPQPGNFSAADARLIDPHTHQAQVSANWIRIDANPPVELVFQDIMSRIDPSLKRHVSKLPMLNIARRQAGVTAQP